MPLPKVAYGTNSKPSRGGVVSRSNPKLIVNKSKESRKRRVSGLRLHASNMAVKLTNIRQSVCMT